MSNLDQVTGCQPAAAIVIIADVDTGKAEVLFHGDNAAIQPHSLDDGGRIGVDAGQQNAVHPFLQQHIDVFGLLRGISIGVVQKHMILPLNGRVLNTLDQLRITGIGNIGDNNANLVGTARFQRFAGGVGRVVELPGGIQHAFARRIADGIVTAA